MVGHTHEAVDRFFSFIARCLRNKKEVMTTDEMIAFVTEYLVDGKTMAFEELDFVGDWKDWMKGCNEDLHDHTRQGSAHHWKFERQTEEGEVLLQYKHLHTDDWAPRQKGLNLVKKIPDVTKKPQPAPYRHFSEQKGYLQGLRTTSKLLLESDLLDEKAEQWWTDIILEKSLDEVPSKYQFDSSTNLGFPMRVDCDSGSDREEEEPDFAYSEAEMRKFGFHPNKEPYTGKVQLRVRRNDYGVNVGEHLGKGSMVMLLSADVDEPLVFGLVTKLLEPKKTFEMQYVGRKLKGKRIHNGHAELNATYEPLLDNPSGKQLVKYCGVHNVNEVLLFDIEMCITRGAAKLFKIKQCSLRKMRAAVEQIGSFKGGKTGRGGSKGGGSDGGSDSSPESEHSSRLDVASGADDGVGDVDDADEDAGEGEVSDDDV